MANTVPSPNMNLPVPVVGVDPGPDWANNINASLSIIDGHTHSAGSGVQVTPSGLNISSDLAFLGNNATQLRSARFTAQGSPISGGADLGCVYVSGVDLWYNDESGNQVRITSGGNVNAGAGSITGLPSGTASASYSSGAFTFQGATNTPAGMNVGPVSIGAEIANAKTVTLQTSNSQASNIAFTLPLTIPGSTSVLVSDSSGNLTFDSNILSGTYSPTISMSGSGLTISVTASQFFYTRIDSIVTIGGNITFNVTSTGTASVNTTVTIPVATTTLYTCGSGACSLNGGENVWLTPSGPTLVNLNGPVAVGSATRNNQTLGFAMSYQVN